MTNCNSGVNIPVLETDPCNGERVSVGCVTDSSTYVDLGIEPNSNQGEINQAIYNALQSNKSAIDSLQTFVGDSIYTVATLPVVATLGERAIVTDATSPTYLGTLVGGGTIKCPAWYNGVTWVNA
jgi:hypothetical protein